MAMCMTCTLLRTILLEVTKICHATFLRMYLTSSSQISPHQTREFNKLTDGCPLLIYRVQVKNEDEFDDMPDSEYDSEDSNGLLMHCFHLSS